MSDFGFDNELRWKPGKDLCASIDQFKPYADQHFSDRLDAFLETTAGTDEATAKWKVLCRSLWEMHVGLACLNRGLDLVPTAKRDLTRGGPDHLVTHGSRRTWIECIASEDAKNADDRVVVPDPSVDSIASYSKDALLLRYAGAFKEKFGAFEKYRSKGIVNDGDRLVIAISGARIEGASYETDPHPHIVRSLFPIGSLEWQWTPGEADSHHAVIPYRNQIPKHGLNSDGTPRQCVPQTAFMEQQHSAIHGVLFSTAQLDCAHDPKAMRFTYVVNPLAKRIRPHRWFKRCIAYQDLDGYLTRTRW